MDKRIFIGLPAYNEKDAIYPLFNKIQQLKASLTCALEIIFYDDGSTDGTTTAVMAWEKQFPIHLIKGNINKGLGTGINALLKCFFQNGSSQDLLVIMDCDDTHHPNQILLMLNKLNSATQVDVVIASRYQKSSRSFGVPTHRVFLSMVATLLLKIIHPIRNVRDYTCGYRIYTHGIINKLFNSFSSPLLKESGFSCMVELLLKLKKIKAKIIEIPLELRYEKKKTPSKMNVFQNSYRLFLKLLVWRIHGLS